MHCPACGSQKRRRVGPSRYECQAPSSREVSITHPPTVGSTWGPVLIEDPAPEPCGVIYIDQEEQHELRRKALLLVM